MVAQLSNADPEPLPLSVEQCDCLVKGLESETSQIDQIFMKRAVPNNDGGFTYVIDI